METLTAPAIILDNAATRLAGIQEQYADEGKAKAAELSARVLELAQAKVDAVADTRVFTMAPTTGLPEGDKVPETWRVVLHGPQGLRLALNEVAHDQVAERLSIPKPFYRRLLASHPELLSENVSTLFRKEPGTQLFRMLRPVGQDQLERATTTGTQVTLRGLLSKSFRPIDDAELLATVLPVMEARGAFLREFSLDDRRMHAKFLTVQQSIQAIRARVAAAEGVEVAAVARHPRVNGRDISWVDEVVRAGAYLRNSEVGYSSLTVSAVWEILKCLNGMIQAAQTRERHAGKKRLAELGEDLSYLKADTQLLDNAATMARVRDALEAALDEKQQVVKGSLLLAAKAENVELPADVPLFQFVGNIANAVGLTEAEGEVMKEEAVHSLRVEGAGSQFAYIQALTATARRMGDYDRRTEYERLGFQLLEDSPAALLKLAAEGAKARKN